MNLESMREEKLMQLHEPITSPDTDNILAPITRTFRTCRFTRSLTYHSITEKQTVSKYTTFKQCISVQTKIENRVE